MKSFGIALVTTLALVAGVSAQQAPSKPETKPAAPAKTVDGRWDLTVVSDQGPISVLATFKMDGTKLTGTLSSQMGDSPAAGELVDGKLKFTIQFDGGGGAMELLFTGAFKDDGSLAGTMSGQMGEMTWTATRAKGV